MSDMWVNIGRVWDHHKPPMRPHADTVEILRRELATDDADVLLLGVTPEFARMGKSLVAVDAGAPMIAALWIGDDSTRRAVLGNWLALPLPDGSVDAVVGDGCLSAVTTAADRLQLLAETARVLRPGGRAGIRLFARPEEPESFDDIRADVAAANVPSLSALMLRVALAMPATGPDYAHKLSLIRDKIDEFAPDRASLIARRGWHPDAFCFLDLFEGSSTACSWPPERVCIEEASRFFRDVTVVPDGDYPGAENCPIMLMSSPR